MLGYLLVAVTLGWFVTNDSALAFAYMGGVVVGAVIGVRQSSRQRNSADDMEAATASTDE